MFSTGTNLAWPYPGHRVTGNQRMKHEDLRAIMA
jgi:hypothetical protein